MISGSSKEVIGDGKSDFFASDSNNEAFGLKPYDYSILRDLEKEYKLKYHELVLEARETLKKKTLKLPELEECSKKYCEDFLREPTGDERPCRRKDKCIAKIMATLFPDSVEEVNPEEGFIAREFLKPSQLTRKERYKKLPDEIQLCLLCNRAMTTFLYYYHLNNKIEIIEPIQDHANVIGPNSYHKDACLVPVLDEKNFTGIIKPYVKFSASNYVYSKDESKGGKKPIKCLKEQNLDFFF
jgi:hypothetical protein